MEGLTLKEVALADRETVVAELRRLGEYCGDGQTADIELLRWRLRNVLLAVAERDQC